MLVRQDRRILRWTSITGAAVALSLVLSAWLIVRTSATGLDGPSVILVRHGDAPGKGEPEGFNLAECRTQRNLSDKGRDDARHLGARFRASDIIITKILSSQWCRARETAKLMDLGPVEDAPAFNDLAFSKQRGNELLDLERKLIAAWNGPGVLLIVSHGSNIEALTDFHLAQGAGIAVSLRNGEVDAEPLNLAPATAKLN